MMNHTTTRSIRVAWLVYITVLLLARSGGAANAAAHAAAGDGGAAEAADPPPSSPPSSSPEDTYLVGIGKADITGPIVDVNLMGYSMPEQIASGLHTRLYARAFVIAERANPRNRALLVVHDAALPSQLLTQRVRAALAQEYGDHLYTRHNVLLMVTHTHASCGGTSQYLAYSLSSYGHVRESFDAMLAGTLEAVRAAHADLRPARLSLAAGELLGASINRSPTAYAANPEAERSRYRHDTDKTMTLLRVHGADDGSSGAGGGGSGSSSGINNKSSSSGGGGGSNVGRGFISWVATHATSLNNSNALISGDNKGAAQIFVEEWAARAPGLGPKFVAAFAQPAGADASPNTQGAFCADSGRPCDAKTSLCNANGGRTNALCWARGPKWPDDMASAEAIGRLQANKAKELWQTRGTPLGGGGRVQAAHTWVDMTNVTVAPSRWGGPVGSKHGGRTCGAAMGFSFAAGTTDGPGSFYFMQSDLRGSPFWRMVRDAIHRPSAAQEACHAPKPIVLDAGALKWPYDWLPSVVDVSLVRIGSLVLAALPGEVTTMAGRRVADALTDTVGGAWGPDLTVIVASMANTYSSYITTEEEYGQQRYEGGFTLYGPHTLSAYIQTLRGLAADMVAGCAPPPPAVQPPDLSERQLSFLGAPGRDAAPPGAKFGDCVVDVAGAYRPGETVAATFRAGNPRHRQRLDGTLLAAERLAGGRWARVADDASWQTTLEWARAAGAPRALPAASYATVSWRIPLSAPSGVYRLRHFGTAVTKLNGSERYEGASGQFVVARTEAEYERAASRFAAAAARALKAAPAGALKGASGAVGAALAAAAHARARQPLVIGPGLALPQIMSPAPARLDRLWLGLKNGGGGGSGEITAFNCSSSGGGGGGGSGSGGGSGVCSMWGRTGVGAAAAAGAAHAFCPEWWRGDFAACDRAPKAG